MPTTTKNHIVHFRRNANIENKYAADDFSIGSGGLRHFTEKAKFNDKIREANRLKLHDDDSTFCYFLREISIFGRMNFSLFFKEQFANVNYSREC